MSNPDRFTILDCLKWRPAVMTLSRNSRRKQCHTEQIHDLSLSFITVIRCIKQHGWSRHVPLSMKHKRVENFIRKHERNHLRRSKWDDNIKTSGKIENMCGYELGGKGDGRWSGRCLVNVIFKLKMWNFFIKSATTGQLSETLTDHVSDYWPALGDTNWSRQRLLASSQRH
jgi:hypothetical protein